ncbi:MAG: Ca-activated chloride channel, partial [Acidobacteriota bacterium]|nr:Ca-activated chloride channel [Acidobacteriota bacterium]
MNSLPKNQASRLLGPLCVSLVLFSSAFGVDAQQANDRTSNVAPPSSATGERLLAVSVTDEKRHYITDLTKEQFTVFDGKTPREITSFSPVGEPASIGVLFDISGSMIAVRTDLGLHPGPTTTTARLDDIRHALMRILRGSPASSEFFIWAFNSKTYKLTDWTRDAKTLTDALSQINDLASSTQPTGKNKANGALYDACAEALDKLAGSSLRKRVLLILTDGDSDTFSHQVTFKELKRRLLSSDTLLYPISLFDWPFYDKELERGKEELDELATASGGHALFPATPAEMNEIADGIALDLRYQYTVGFSPADVGGADGTKLRKVKIKVTPPSKEMKNLIVLYRES